MESFPLGTKMWTIKEKLPEHLVATLTAEEFQKEVCSKRRASMRMYEQESGKVVMYVWMNELNCYYAYVAGSEGSFTREHTIPENLFYNNMHK